MEDTQPQQVFVRNDKGRLWGPLAPQTLELLLDNGLIEGRIQISTDGRSFAFPGRFEDLREFVPPELWGEGFAPPPGAAPVRPPAHVEQVELVAAPVPAAGPGTAPMAGPGAMPRAGPGAVPMAGPGAVPRAGPGARAAAAPRAGPGIVPGAGPPRAAQLAPPPIAPAVTPVAPPVVPAASPPAEARSESPAPEDQPSALPAGGELARVSPVRLYYLAASGQQTGRLSFRLSDRVIDLHFRKGNPEHVASDHPEDAVGDFLRREGLARADQLAAAEVALGKFGGDLLSALFGTGALNPATAFSHLAQRAQGLLLRALGAESGTFRWTEEELPSQKAMPLGNRWAVLMELCRKIPPAELRRRLQPALDHPVMKSSGQVALADLRLSPQETRAVVFIDGVRSLNLLAHDLPQDADTFYRLAWVLREMDVVSFAATRLPPPGDAPPPPVVAPAPPVVAPAPPVITAARPAQPASPRPARPSPPVVTAPDAPPDYAAQLEALRAELHRHKDQNHFQVLGLTDKADSAQVKLAYFKLARLYHPDTVPQDAPVEVGKLKAEIFGRVGDAYRALGDDATRARYLEDLRAGGGSDADVDVGAILHAEELFQKGCILLKAKKFPEAVELLTDAINLNVDEGEFYAWRGAARFFAQKDRKQGQAEAQRDFDQALKKNARCAAAYFFQGQVAKLLGDPKKALGHFNKTLDLQPDHLDAQREIRYLTKK